jgi:hypothetical protein
MLGSQKVATMLQYMLSQLQGYTFLPLEAASGGRKVEAITQQSSEFGLGDGFGDAVFGDITGIYKASPCKIRTGGVWCMTYNPNGNGFAKARRWFVFTRESALRPGKQFWLADLEGSGKAGLVWEEDSGVMFAASDGVGSFKAPRTVLAYSSDYGWRMSPGYSFHFGHFDKSGREGLLVRGWFGLKVFLSDGTQLKIHCSSAQFADSQGWAAPQYVVRVGDIDGDGIDDVCGRGPAGVLCSNIALNAIGPATLWTSTSDRFTDGDGWAADANAYSSFALADIFGQGKKVPTGRNGASVPFTGTDGSKFLDYRQLVDSFPLDLAPKEVWQSAPVYFADIDGDGQEEPVWMLTGGLYSGLTQIVLQAPAK